MTGRIDFLQAREGDRVTQGEVLVRNDPSTVEAQVREQQASLAEAQFRLAQAQLNQNPTNVAITRHSRGLYKIALATAAGKCWPTDRSP